MRIPVIDVRGIPLMPCTPPKARALLKAGKARPKRNKLGLFYVQLTYEQEPTNQSLVVGIDPSSRFEGYSVVGTKETVHNLMVEAPTYVKQAVERRRAMRRARRFRLWRRPCRGQNRLARTRRLPPSTRIRWEAKARIAQRLATILPLSDVAVEDVQATTRPGAGRRWNQSFSPVQVGKEHLYRLLQRQGLSLHVFPGVVTKQLLDHYRLTKTSRKDAKTFSSHALDAWALAASVSGAPAPTCARLWYGAPHQLHRRQLHRLEASKGCVRRPYGGTRSLGFKRGTLIHHPKYGLCAVGGYDRDKQQLSLRAYKTNKRLTQHAHPVECHRLTSSAFRCWLVPHMSARRHNPSNPGKQAHSGLERHPMRSPV
jgi:hypothetical protein